jgi:hypothetical protein
MQIRHVIANEVKQSQGIYEQEDFSSFLVEMTQDVIDSGRSL